MDDLQLRQIIDEMISELSPKTMQRYADRVGGDAQSSAPIGTSSGEIGHLEKKAQQQHKAGDTTGLQKTARQYQKRWKGLGQAVDKMHAQKRGQAPAAAATPRVKNPSTGEEILATTAYKAGPTHPAYAAAKSALKKEIAIRKSMNESHKVIRLTDFLVENAERRVNLMKIQAIMEKLYPELTSAQSKKLTELCTEVHMMASQMNTIPYIRTESSMTQWAILEAAFKAKVVELKEEVTKVCEDKKIDCTTVVKALDEVLTY